MQGQLWVEPVGNLIMARIRGVPSQALLTECQRQVLQLLKDTGRGKVLYDALEMEPPPVDITLVQQKLDAQLDSLRLRRAILVPNNRLSFLSRLAFGDGDYRVFYNDMTAAIMWLELEESPD